MGGGLRRIGSLIAALAITLTGLILPQTANAATLPSSIVNGDFSYPNLNGIFSSSSTSDGTYIEADTGRYFKVKNGQFVTQGPIRGFDQDKFGWRSNDSGIGLVHVVELRWQNISNRWAEIAAETTGASKYLYQDVRTTPGTTLNWRLDHGSRNAHNNEAMQVRIGSTSSQTAQQAYRISSRSGDPIGSVGTTIRTSGSVENGKWSTYGGSYKVPAGQTVTRFTFLSLYDTADPNGAHAEGNEIDNVQFGVEVPPPVEPDEPDPVYVDLHYNANGGNGSHADTTVEENTTATIPSNLNNSFNRPGYTLTGWTENPNGSGTVYQPGGRIPMGTSDKTLYAQWSANDVHLNYDANGGNGTHDPTEGEVNTNITIPGDLNDSFDRPGYEITSWNTKPDGSGTTYQPGGNVPMGTTDQTIYAQWDSIDVQLKYDPNGGEGSHDPTKGKANSDITIPSDINDPFHRDHYELTGWNTKPDGSGDSYAPNDKVHMGITDQTLYAQWKRIPVKVNYDPNGGNGSHDPTTGDAGSDITIPSDVNDPFNKPGSILTGWNTKPDGSGDSYEPGDKLPMGDEDKTLYAQWKELPSVMPSTGGDGAPVLPAIIAGAGLIVALAGWLIARRMRGDAR